MTESTDRPATPRRTVLPMVLWTAAILAAMGLAWFVGAIVVPIHQVRAVIRTRGIFPSPMPAEPFYPDPLLYHKNVLEFFRYSGEAGRATTARLGGKEAAARKLRVYLRAPTWVAPQKLTAVCMLYACEEAAVPGLTDAMRSHDGRVREAAAAEAGLLGRDLAAPAIPDVEGLLSDPNGEVRRVAASALKRLKAEESAK